MKDKILIVENEWMKRYWADKQLEERGYHVMTASNEKDFWENAFDPDLAVIVLDIHRRNRLGADIYRALLDFGMNRHVPIIFTTGVAEETAGKPEIIRDEDYTFISGPVNFKTFCEEVERFRRVQPVPFSHSLDRAV